MKLVARCLLIWALNSLAVPIGLGQTLHSTNDILFEVDHLEYSKEGWLRYDKQGTGVPVDVVRWGSWAGVQDEQALWLADGSWLCGDLEIGAESVTVHSDWFDAVKLPISTLRGIVLNPQASLKDWVQLRRWMRTAEGTEDQILLQDGQSVSGVLSITPADELNLEQFQLRGGGSAKSLQWDADEIRAIIFSPALVGRLPESGGVLQMGLEDGASFMARR